MHPVISKILARFGIVKKRPFVNPRDVENLGLVMDLGIIKVPTNYEHSTCLARFAKSKGWQFKVYQIGRAHV